MCGIEIYTFKIFADLRWNQLGPNEGKFLLNAVQDSPQLTCIQLEGNLYNSDLIMAIG
jgi:hypothetical protein